MNREIRFRAWDGRSMNDEQLLSITMQGDLQSDGGSAGVRGVDYPLMQFTGLKDKNGTEIYEGDVVRWDVNETSVTAPVGFESGAFWMLESIETSFAVYNDWGRGEYEVIGNLYENPELLEKGEG